MPLRDGGFVSKEGGAHVCISAWRRVDDNAIPARGKISGSYANSLMIRTDAMIAGYDDAIVLNNDGHIAECSVANFFLVRKGVAITPPVTANVLEGIVRRSLIELLREELGVEVAGSPCRPHRGLSGRRDVHVRHRRPNHANYAYRASSGW